MSVSNADLARDVNAFRPFLPAKNFEVSRSFYRDIGFREELLDQNLVEMHLGSYSFLLQNFYIQQWAENAMMHVLVEEADRWWAHIAGLDLPARYGVEPPRAPKCEPWGLRVLYLFDPSGVLWHLAELSSAKA